ncbi:MAG TPA: thiolase family protein, partial [Longimicrobiales bacterium]|nr:thiolase family protein [Longimicrobiales bacterium]
MDKERTAVIVGAARTPIGRFLGGLAPLSATELGAVAIRAAVERSGVEPGEIEEVILGNVVSAGLGQAPARQAAMRAGLPETVGAMAVSRVCGSGLQAVMLAAQSIRAGDNRCVIAGGFESMSRAPHFAFLRNGAKFGGLEFKDHMQHDGLTCAFECWGMTNAADHIAERYQITREDQDRFSAQSHARAAEAAKNGWFDAETAALTGEQVGNRKQPGPEGGVSKDEGVRADSTAEVLGKLRTVPGHKHITAGNASQISDGAAAVCVMS